MPSWLWLFILVAAQVLLFLVIKRLDRRLRLYFLRRRRRPRP